MIITASAYWICPIFVYIYNNVQNQALGNKDWIRNLFYCNLS